MKIQSKFIHFIEENVFENVWEMLAILSRHQCVNNRISEIMTWIRNNIHSFQWDAINHAYHNFSQAAVEWMSN